MIAQRVFTNKALLFFTLLVVVVIGQILLASYDSRLSKEKDCINVVNDQKGNPTCANDLAYHILKLIETEEYGIYHCTGKGECTWYDFAKMIIELSGEKCEVKPCTSEEYKTIAKRPEYSALDNLMLRITINDQMRDWKEAIKSFIEKLDKAH